MKMEIVRATVKNDSGTAKLKVVSLSGKHGAIKQIITSENCPECAILKIVKVIK